MKGYHLIVLILSIARMHGLVRGYFSSSNFVSQFVRSKGVTVTSINANSNIRRADRFKGGSFTTRLFAGGYDNDDDRPFTLVM